MTRLSKPVETRYMSVLKKGWKQWMVVRSTAFSPQSLAPNLLVNYGISCIQYTYERVSIMARSDVTFYPNAGIVFFFPFKEHFGYREPFKTKKMLLLVWEKERCRVKKSFMMCVCVGNLQIIDAYGHVKRGKSGDDVAATEMIKLQQDKEICIAWKC